MVFPYEDHKINHQVRSSSFLTWNRSFCVLLIVWKFINKRKSIRRRKGRWKIVNILTEQTIFHKWNEIVLVSDLDTCCVAHFEKVTEYLGSKKRRRRAHSVSNTFMGLTLVKRLCTFSWVMKGTSRDRYIGYFHRCEQVCRIPSCFRTAWSFEHVKLQTEASSWYFKLQVHKT